MAQVTLTTADRIRVPDRAGQVVINRYVWPVTAQTNGDSVLIGYLPADCKIVPGASQVVADGSTAAMTFDVCVGGASNVIAAAVPVVLNTFKQVSVPSAAIIETLGTSPTNRPVTLTLTTAPTAAGGKVIVELAVFDPAA